MRGHPLGGGELCHDTIAVKHYAVVARSGFLATVAKLRTELGLWHVGRKRPVATRSGNGHEEYVAIVLAACAVEMGVTETVYGVVAVVIGTASVPPLETGVGTGLYLPEGDDGSGIGVTVEVSSHKGVDISAVAVLAACDHKKQQQTAQKEIVLFFHGKYLLLDCLIA